MVRDTLRDFAGAWHVLIHRAQTDPWWIVVLDGEGGGFKQTVPLDPSETPEAVRRAIDEALKGAV